MAVTKQCRARSRLTQWLPIWPEYFSHIHFADEWTRTHRRGRPNSPAPCASQSCRCLKLHNSILFFSQHFFYNFHYMITDFHSSYNIMYPVELYFFLNHSIFSIFNLSLQAKLNYIFYLRWNKNNSRFFIHYFFCTVMYGTLILIFVGSALGYCAM